MSFRRVKNVKMIVLLFHQVCMKLKNLSYPLKNPTLNSRKLKKIFFENTHNLTNNDFRTVIKWKTRKVLSLRQMRY